ncbi:MAG: hypothetical protein IV100_23835 [Myxococcales bacterium]|nr:hypothetical protein [Myxococcales bacterium]
MIAERPLFDLRRRGPAQGLALGLLLLAAPACDPGATVLNVAPAVTAVGPVTFDNGEVTIGVWLRDHERDSVDLTIVAELDGTPLTLDEVEVGLLGLTTLREAPGRHHALRWTPVGATGGSKLRLRVLATDSEGDTGLEASTPEFTLSEGLDAP